MTDEDRARLRRLAQDLASEADCDRLLYMERDTIGFLEGMEMFSPDYSKDALDAIALWSLLGEPTCLLCGAGRKDTVLSGPPFEQTSLRYSPGPDAGSVLCGKCRSYPNRGGR